MGGIAHGSASQNDSPELFGATQSTVAKWFAKGWLMAAPKGGCASGAVRFIAQHSSEWHFKKVDEAWLKGLLFGCQQGTDKQALLTSALAWPRHS